ncbi:unnamed protein product [Dibothriocephalus latus]|uniref:EF-hand domain-containing protein n=1 Tax=Dibothriocephalus latus TaxID=60516 RepID=A0A3P7LW61_DIBLA|nr:unnamed protein product [Dibothriocephalus latus]
MSIYCISVKPPLRRPVGKEAALKAFKAMDTDNSGSVSFEEFLDSIKREATEEISVSNLRKFFKKIDTDNNGVISLAELEELFC